LKKIVFLIIASLLVLGLVLPGCDQAIKIKVIIAGPMTYLEGRHMWYGAKLAANQILFGLGGGNLYEFKLIMLDDNEIADPAQAGTKLAAKLAANPDCKIVIGGCRAGAVATMIPIAMDRNVTMFIDGAAVYSLLSGPTPFPSGTGTPYYPYSTGAAGYGYIFRGAPLNDIFQLNNAFLMTTMVAKRIEGIISANSSKPVKIAILAEDSSWADWMVASAENIFGSVAPNVLGWPWQLAGVYRVSSSASGSIITPILNAIKADGAHIIFTLLAGSVGVTFGHNKGELGVPAIAVGINLQAQYPTYWAATQYSTSPDKYGAEDEITLTTWAPGVNQTTKTANFLSGFVTWPQNADKEFPIYTAASYDILWSIRNAMLGVNSINNALLIPWYENINNAFLTTTGMTTYYPQWDGTMTGSWMDMWGGGWPVLNSTQRDYYYNSTNHLIGYNPACNFTMAPYTTHDLVYGPTWQTGVGIQWQNVIGTGKQVGIWPNSGDWTDQNMISRAFVGINWTDVEYPGTTDFTIPDWMCENWTGDPC
jgi:ABC-type branched-subunit amino acid transport system substrate-binding protein